MVLSMPPQVHHLLPKLRAAGNARVLSLSSRAHMRHPDAIDYTRLKNESAATYDGWHAYGRSKLSNIFMAKVRTPSCCAVSMQRVACGLFYSQALAARFSQSTGVCFLANHPGLVDTGNGVNSQISTRCTI